MISKVVAVLAICNLAIEANVLRRGAGGDPQAISNKISG
jgi:hypothetical protein